MVDLPAFWYRPIGFVIAENAHSLAVERMRAKLACDPGFIEAEADRMVRCDFDGVPSTDTDAMINDEDEREEVRMREDAREHYRVMLRRTESDMWGLGIAGLFHHWERDTKHLAASYITKPPTTLERMKFTELCIMLETLEFDIKHCRDFSGLETVRMISNTIKHGEGPDFRALTVKHPELVADFKPSRWKKNPHPDDLRFTAGEFDTAATAIGGIWEAFEKARQQIAPTKSRYSHTGA